MKQLFLTLILLNLNLASSQELVLKKMDFFLNETKLRNNEIKEKLSSDEKALNYYKTAKNKSTVGGLFLGFGLGFVVADAIAGGYTYNYKFPGTPTFIGLGAIAVSIPVLSGRKKLLQKSVDTYNINNSKFDKTENSLEISVISNNNGVGLQLNF